MTREELGKLQNIQKEIKIIQQQISNIDCNKFYRHDSVTGSEPNFPYVKRVIGVKGYDYDAYYTKLDRLNKKLKRKLEALMDERDRVMDFINTVSDSVLRQILILKYINGMTWEQIGAEIGYSARSIRRKHASFFQQN